MTETTAHPERKESLLYDCEDQTEVELLDRKKVSHKLRDSILVLERLNTGYNWKIAVFAALWALTGWITLTNDNIMVTCVATVFMAFALNGTTILMHEACHSLLSKNLSFNRWLGFFCGVPGLVAVSAYRSIHLTHHGFVKTDKDPDDIERSTPKFLPLVLTYYLALILGIYLYLPSVAVVGFKKASNEGKKKILLEYGILAVFYATILFLVPFNAVLQLWLYPFLIAAQLSNVRGLAEHGLTTGGNAFTSSRTVLSNRFVSFFICNLNYHLEHHLFPGVPWYHLPAVHTLLRDEFTRAGSSVYRSYTEFLLDFFNVTWKQRLAPDVRMIPQHIREEICS